MNYYTKNDGIHTLHIHFMYYEPNQEIKIYDIIKNLLGNYLFVHIHNARLKTLINGTMLPLRIYNSEIDAFYISSNIGNTPYVLKESNIKKVYDRSMDNKYQVEFKSPNQYNKDCKVTFRYLSAITL